MSRTMTQEERYRMMTEKPISRLIPGLAVPTIISMLITSIYNMADTFFVSQINTSASAAVGIIFSLMAMIQAVGFTLGMGAGNYISRSLGAKNEDIAVRTAATAFFTAIGIGVVMAVTGLSFLDRLVRLLGATETIAPYARDYARYILLGAPVMTGSFVMNNLLRSQGYAVYAKAGITTGGILNMILDPVFIFGLRMGISGAAAATVISQCVSFCILFFQCNFRKGCIRLRPGKFTPSLKIYGEILHAGLPSLCRQGLASAAAVALNVAANPFGDAAIAAMSIVTRYMMFINSALIGFGQGFQPVCGFNFGAKRYDRVLEEINAVKKACAGRLLKVIIETCLLTEEEKTELCRTVTRSDAEFIKTSTGFSAGGATFADVELMKAQMGEGKQIKAAGGISGFHDAETFIRLGADRLGTSRLAEQAKKKEVELDEEV